MSNKLGPDRSLIFRILHRSNLPWTFEHGLHCQNSEIKNPAYIGIGNEELIEKRTARPVDTPPGGTLSDYVPFYFTPYSPMLYNIKTGHSVCRLSNEEIVIMVSSLHKLTEMKKKFIFTDRHAYLTAAQFFTDIKNLNHIDWKILRNRDFQRDADDRGKFERYQAEALVWRHVPMDALLGIACFNEDIASSVRDLMIDKNLDLKVISKPEWYFS